MPIKVPKLESRYIPVHSNAYVISSSIHWWKYSSPFIYPNVLINLLSCTKEQMDDVRKDSSEELFLLTDSGGFQVISGQCNLTWEQSLLKQIELGATKIFAFDKPPVKRAFQGSLTQFTYMTDKETRDIIKMNFEVALQQSKYLKEKYPEELKKFCYILHAKNYEHIEYNIELFEKEFGNKYLEYFPGGIVYAIKGNDLMFETIAARHAWDNFTSKGIYVHFLGMGSFNRMLILIRNKISTFDSSSVLQGIRANEFVNPIVVNDSLQVPSKDFIFTKQFCSCPVCSAIDYNEIIKSEQFQMIGWHFIAHNLWHLLKINIFLDAIPLKRYTEIVKNNFRISEDTLHCLEFCDTCAEVGFKIAFDKYKHFLKKDETKQLGLF